jgi:hypothetical protein
VSRRFNRLEADATELDASSVGERRERVFGLRRRAEIDARADPIAQLQMAGDEVGVEMRQDHMFDAQPVLFGVRHILLDVALWIDDGGNAALLIPDDVGRVREAIQVELMKDHAWDRFARRQV